ncbi:DUF222 domain-containing protein [Arthrobacter alpinus]|uniref:DUF222 domain-containing protein n=1 Tax=Arthrobacter alpinus TaxID=656366 RepID=UPI001FCD672E
MENLQSSVAFEGSILTLDPWQQANSLAAIKAELAGALHVAEGAAERLKVQFGALVRDLTSTLAAIECGELGWDFAVIIAEQTCLLHAAETAQEGIDAFDELLMAKARDAHLNSFREMARRRRERAHPETIVHRTRRAYADRSLRVSRSRDGMSWLSFYAPSPHSKASGINVRSPPGHLRGHTNGGH